MKEIESMFFDLGIELSKLQLNDIFLEMNAGRSFRSQKLKNWVSHNFRFLMKKIPRTKRDLNYSTILPGE